MLKRKKYEDGNKEEKLNLTFYSNSNLKVIYISLWSRFNSTKVKILKMSLTVFVTRTLCFFCSQYFLLLLFLPYFSFHIFLHISCLFAILIFVHVVFASWLCFTLRLLQRLPHIHVSHHLLTSSYFFLLLSFLCLKPDLCFCACVFHIFKPFPPSADFFFGLFATAVNRIVV